MTDCLPRFQRVFRQTLSLDHPERSGPPSPLMHRYLQVPQRNMPHATCYAESREPQRKYVNGSLVNSWFRVAAAKPLLLEGGGQLQHSRTGLEKYGNIYFRTLSYDSSFRSVESSAAPSVTAPSLRKRRSVKQGCWKTVDLSLGAPFFFHSLPLPLTFLLSFRTG